MRITNNDLQELIAVVNGNLAQHGNKRINARRHMYNSFTCLETVVDKLPVVEPFFCGTKAQCYDILMAMLKMYYYTHPQED